MAGVSAKQIRPWIIALIAGVVLTFIGMAVATITGGVSLYVVKQLNTSTQGVISNDVNMFNSNVLNLMGNVFLFIGIALIVVAAVFIIKSLAGTIGGLGGGGEEGGLF